MTELEMLNRVREAIACLDAAANYIPIESQGARKLHSRIQDAGDALVEVREEIQVRIEVQERLKRSLER